MQSNVAWLLEYRGQEYLIPPQGLRIGRGYDNDVIIQDDQVSRRHAYAWDAQGIVFIRDEGSMNGTFVNGKRIAAPTPLRPDDRIEIGQTMLRVRLATGGAAPAVSSARASNLSYAIGTGVAMLIVGLMIGSIVLLVLAAPSPAAPTTRQPLGRSTPTMAIVAAPATRAPITPATATQRALMAAVEIAMPLDRSSRIVYGSGSIIDARGYVLTNFHVVRDPNTGRPFNSEDRIYVGVSTSTDRPPDRIFRAQVVVLDNNLDLALLRLIAMKEGGPLPADLGLTAIPVGDSDTVQIGDRIQVIGFPGLGGDTVTLTQGIVSGFLDGRAWIKTDTQINRGNSGGIAINLAGELIGVPTDVVTDPQLSGKIGLIRPINLAKPLLQQAK